MSECQLFTGPLNDHGYGKVNMISAEGTRLRVGAHRLSYALHYGEDPDGYVVMHKCDNTSCVNPEHLQLGTQLENIEDRESKGRGAKHRLSPENILGIRDMLARGYSQRSIAKHFGVSQTTINVINQKRAWNQV